MDIYVRFLIGSFFFLGLNLNTANSPAAQQESPFSMRVDVELVTTEVIALDKHGEPVRNLKKEDFKLYEDGKQQDILSFDEVTEQTAAVSPANLSPFGDEGLRPGKSVLIIFDDSTIASPHLKAARDSAATFVKQHMNPGDIFGVASFDMSLKILQPFTDDSDAVLKAVGQPAVSSASNSVGQTGLVDNSQQQENLLRALNILSLSIERLRGQKSILVYSESMYSSDYLSTLYTSTLKTARRCNAVFYTVDPAGLNSPAVATGGGALGAGSTGIGGSSTIQAPGIDTTFSKIRPGQNLMRSLASETGGFSIFNTNDLNTELDKLDKQLSNYYILGFQSSNPKHDGAFRKLEVKIDLKGITLKYPKGYLDRRPLDTLKSSKPEKTLLNALASPSEASQLPLVFRASYFYDSPRLARVLVSARIGTEKITLNKKEKELAGDLNLMGIAYAENGSASARFSQTLHLSFDKEKEEEFRKSRVPYDNYFKLHPGKYRLKLAVSDEKNNLGTADQILEIPAPPEKEYAASSLVIPEQLTQLPPLIQNLQTRLLDADDPMIFRDMQITPSVEHRLRVNAGIPVLFRIYNLTGDRNSWKFSAAAKLISEDGKEIGLPALPLDQYLSPVARGEAAIALTLPFQNETPGRYKLVVETVDAVSKKSAETQTDVELYQDQ